MRLVVSQSGIDRNAGEVLLYESHQTIDDHKVFSFFSGPHIVRCQISRPDNITNILEHNNCCFYFFA